MPKPGPRTTYKYSDEFKATAVHLSQLPGVQIQEVAASLYIHSFMLSRWREQAREGLIVARKVEIDKATVAVGTAIARRPPHRSVRAALPHTAPASSHDAKR